MRTLYQLHMMVILEMSILLILYIITNNTNNMINSIIVLNDFIKM